jgi:hypothetical protein
MMTLVSINIAPKMPAVHAIKEARLAGATLKSAGLPGNGQSEKSDKSFEAAQLDRGCAVIRTFSFEQEPANGSKPRQSVALTSLTSSRSK